MTLRSALWTLVAVTAFTAALTAALVRPATPTRDVALVEMPWEAKLKLLALEFERQPGTDGKNRHTLTLSADDPVRLAEATQISLRLATYGERVTLETGELRLDDACLFRTRPGDLPQDNMYWTFYRERSCVDTLQPAPSHRLAISVVSTGAPRLAVWTGSPDVKPYYVAASTLGITPVAFPFGSYRTEAPAASLTRGSMLGYAWNLDADATSRFFRLGFTAIWLLLAAGSLGFLARRFLPLSGAAIFAGLALSYALIVPPFQAPDEPNHFLTMAKIVGSDTLAKEGLDLANRGHFDRLTYRSEEKLTLADFGVTRPAPWPGHVGDEPQARRSPLARLVWPIYVRRLAALGLTSAHSVIFGTRVLNTLFVAMALAFGAWMSRPRCVTHADPTWVGFVPFLFIPTWAFFAMHFSNYAFLLAGFALQAWVLVAWLSAPRLNWRSALCLGIGLALAIYGAKPGALTLVFWAFVGCLAAAAAATEKRQPWVPLGLLVTVALGYALVAVPVIRLLGFKYYDDPIYLLCDKAQDAYGPPRELMFALVPTLIVVFVLASWWLGPMLRRAWTAQGWNRTWNPRLATIGKCLAVFFLIYSALSSHADVPSIEGTAAKSVAHLRYVTKVLSAFGLGLGFGRSEFYLVDSFWSGFGWLEVKLGPMVGVFRALPTAGLLVLLLGFLPAKGVAPDCERQRGTGFYLMTLAAIFAWLAVIALGSYGTPSYNVHGRYIIGNYLFYTELMCIVLWRYLRADRRLPESWQQRGALLWCGVNHLYALIFLIERYV